MIKILCVDDEEDLLFTLETNFKDSENNYQFVGVNSGEKCLQKLQNEEDLPDLILLDIMMPKMSGWEVYDKIHDNPEWRHIPIVFLTARTDRVAENAGEFLGDDYIEKPIEFKDLLKHIDKILDK